VHLALFGPPSVRLTGAGPILARRLLLAQAQVEGLALVTPDERVARYAANVFKV